MPQARPSLIPASTLTPFLYNTSTILRPRPQPQYARCISSSKPHRAANFSKRKIPHSQIPFALGNEDSAFAIDQSSARENRAKTLTEIERRAFQRLFSSIEDSTPSQRLPSKSSDAANNPAVNDLFPDLTSKDHEQLARLLGEVTSQTPAEDAPIPDENIERFPESLRGMAARAEAARQQVLSRPRQTSHAPIAQEDENSQIGRERAQLTLLTRQLQAAQTDAQVWSFLTDIVWPDMKALQDWSQHPGPSPLTSANADVEEAANYGMTPDEWAALSKQQRGGFIADRQERHRTMSPSAIRADKLAQRKIAKAKGAPLPPNREVKAHKAQRDAEARARTRTPRFLILVSAYSALILAAMRQLTHRTAYSPLTLQVIPATQALGLGAYALGVSTALYNEQLEYQWRVLHDYAGMLRTLEEMSRAGVEADEQTLEVLSQVSRYRYQAEGGQFGEMTRMAEGLLGRTRDAAALKGWAEETRAKLRDQAVRGARRAEEERLAGDAMLLD